MPADYDLAALRAFIAVVEAGSFHAAAERLGGSTAAISRRVSGLEQALGVRLLHRTTRRLDLTEAGRRYHADLAVILESLDAADERARSGSESLSGLLRVAAPLSFGVQRISPLIPRFLAEHPQLQIQLLVEDQYTDLLANGMDLAIRIGRLDDSSLIATRIGQVDRIFCASPDYLARMGEPSDPRELIHHACLHYNLIRDREEWTFNLDGQAQGLAVHGPLSANNGEVLREAVLQGMGIALLPDFLVDQALAEGRLKAILRQHQPAAYGLYAMRPSRQFTAARVSRFIAFLGENLAG